MAEQCKCPYCGNYIKEYKNPIPAVDIIIYSIKHGVIVISRKNEPLGFAFPGGFVEYGETVEHAAIREAYEETGLQIILQGVLGVYSKKDRDPRHHTLSVVFVAYPLDVEKLKAGDDAASAKFFPLNNIPALVFDHKKIFEDFKCFLQGKQSLAFLARQEL